MKNKIWIIFAILFVILFSVATVAANDVNDTDTIGEIAEEQTIESVDVLKSTDNQIDENNSILTAADGDTLSADEGSFKDLQNLIDGAEESATIYLDRDYAYKDTDTIEINKNITIIGNGHYLDGQGEDRIFDMELEGGKRVVLKNITFKNGDVTWTSGGAIRCIGVKHNQASLYITGCTFDNNHADDGGAIYIEYIGAYIENCRFINNAADDHGGAIQFYTRESTVTRCYFENNMAKDYGGTIHFLNSDGDQRKVYERNNRITLSTFINNHAEYGGAIYANGLQNAIISCNFYKNHADTDGGAIYDFTYGEGNDLVEDCVFEENSANHYGGAIYAKEYNPRFYYSVFDKNTAEKAKDLYIEFCNAYDQHKWDHQNSIVSCIFIARDSIYTNQVYFTGFNECWFPNGHDIQIGTNMYIAMENEIFLKFEYVKNSGSPYIIKGYFTFKKTSEDTYRFPSREFTIETTTGAINTTKIDFGLDKASFEYIPDYTYQNGEITFKFMDYQYVLKIDHTAPDSFTALQYNITHATSTLTLENDFSYNETIDSQISREGVLIDKTLTINGNGHTINGNNITVFKINNPSANVIFNDLIFGDCPESPSSFSSAANAVLELSTSSTSSTSLISNDSLLESSEAKISSSGIESDSSFESTSPMTSSTAKSSETATVSSLTSSDALTALKQHNKTMNKAKIKNNLLFFIFTTYILIFIKISFVKYYIIFYKYTLYLKYYLNIIQRN